jgi:cellulose synthase/poly-beta-1,6-N-acetylglucosamine synthase-like glycosyltransferase
MLLAHVLLQLIYFVCIVGLGLYGFQAFWLTVAYQLAHRDGADAAMPSAWPTVTVQLPIYNERHVVERLISACAALDYPRDRLQIQILDDSDDLTAALTASLAQQWQVQGVNVCVVRRPDRQGFKAGALAHALPSANGEFIAIFDADFVPTPDFLKSTLPHFYQSRNAPVLSAAAPAPSGEIGFVQTRWDHINRGYSWITRAQALALDGHFVVEQTGRAAAHYPFGFNGTAGIWRRACIDDPAVGGWQTDTLCEDLDLSYRAQLVGWRGVYLPDVSVPAELPAQILAFKRQQFRWAKGSVQTLLKLAHRIPAAPWSFAARLAAIGHLGNYLIHPLLLVMLLVSLPMTLLGVDPAAPLTVLSAFSFGPPLLYAVAQRRLETRHWLLRWANLPMLMLLGTSLCLNNSVAVLQAFLGTGGPFLRTPKFHLHGPDDRWQHSVYRLPLPRLILGEAALALYAGVAALTAALTGHWAAVPFMLIYAVGFFLMVATQIVQAWQTTRPAPRVSPMVPARDALRRRVGLETNADHFSG